MKRTRSESSPTTLKSVRFDENLSNSQLNSGNAKDIEEKKSPRFHKKNTKTEKMQDSQSSISEVLTSPNTKFYAVAGDGIVVVSLDDVMAYCQANKRIKKPNPNRRRESKQKTIDLLEDIMKEIALFQHMILNRPKGLLSDLLQMKEVEKINFLSSVSDDLSLIFSKSKTGSAWLCILILHASLHYPKKTQLHSSSIKSEEDYYKSRWN